MAPPSWIVEAETKGFGKTIYDTSKPGVFDKDFGGTVPVLVDLHARRTRSSRTRRRCRPSSTRIYRAMQWVKATPLDEV